MFFFSFHVSFFVLRLKSNLLPFDKMTDDGSDRFEIERIVDKRYRNDRLEYLIKWRGYPDSQNTWEPCKSSKKNVNRIFE
jgi:hypothetical protein